MMGYFGGIPARVQVRPSDLESRVFGSVSRADLLRIAAIIVIAGVLLVMSRLIARFLTRRWARSGTPHRRAQRAATLATVFRSLFTGIVLLVALFSILSALGFDLAPFIAGASVLGVALGFGAQSLVKDFLAGAWMLVEDQFGVGDVIDAGPARGTVEALTLRMVTLRDAEGTVWHIPNGTIERIGNFTQTYSKAIVDIAVAVDADIDQALSTMHRAVAAIHDDPAYNEELLGVPEILGIESIGVDRITIRVVITTAPSRQWNMARVLRESLLRALQQAGVALPRGSIAGGEVSGDRKDRP